MYNIIPSPATYLLFYHLLLQLVLSLLKTVSISALIYNSNVPSFIQLPPNIIYYESVHQSLTIHTSIQPKSAHLILISDSESLGSFSPTNVSYNISQFLIQSKPPHKKLFKITKKTDFNINSSNFTIILNNIKHFLTKSLHFKLVNSYGTLLSYPFIINPYKLERFPEKGDEYVEFYMGNIAQLVFATPQSDPSPAHIQFLYKDNPINITLKLSNRIKYKLVHFPPLFDRVALLINNLEIEDSGQYKCQAYFPHTAIIEVSKKVINLIVKRPMKKLPPRFIEASHTNLQEDATTNVSIPSGSTLTLYCIYESAPILDVSWYWPNPDRQYILDSHFGTLTIKNVSKLDEDEISCMNNEAKTKSFRIQVTDLPKLVIIPASIKLTQKDFNKPIKFQCKSNIEQIRNRIFWVFNGLMASSVKNVKVRGNKLIIRRVQFYNIGIYQCFMKFKSDWLTNQATVSIVPSVVLRSQQISYINRDESAKLHCGIPQQLSYRNIANGIVFRWYMGQSANKLITTRGGRYHVVLGENELQSQLEIETITQSDHNQTYVCRIYSKQNRGLLAETLFLLNSENKFQNQPKNQDKKSQLILSKPQISLATERFLLWVYITWNLRDSKLSNRMLEKKEEEGEVKNVKKIESQYHYVIEYQMGTKYVKQHIWRSKVYLKRLPYILWNNSTFINKSFNNSQAILYGVQILQPQRWFRFRVIAMRKMKVDKYISGNEYQRIISSWSLSINYEHIIETQPVILNYTIYSGTTANILWRYDTSTEHPIDIEFQILYLPQSRLQIQSFNHNIISPSNPSQWYSIVFRNTPIQLMNINRYPISNKISPISALPKQMKKLSHLSSSIYTFHQINLTDLLKDCVYLVTIYAKHRPMNGAAKLYSSLSQSVMIDTSTFNKLILSKPPLSTKTISQPPHRGVPPPTATKSVTTATNFIITNSDNLSDHGTETTQFQNKILFLVLGSLAGILFVIAFCMFIMCLWYQIRYHNKKRQNNSASSSIKTSSAHTFVPPPANLLFHSSNGANLNHLTSSCTSPPSLTPHSTSLLPESIPQNHTNSKLSHLYLAQHLSLWSPGHLAQFDHLSSAVQEQILQDQQQINSVNNVQNSSSNGSNNNNINGNNNNNNNNSNSPTTTLSTPSHKSRLLMPHTTDNINDSLTDANNLLLVDAASIEDSQEESVRLLDYQPHSTSTSNHHYPTSQKRYEDQCTLNNAFSIQSEVLKDNEELPIQYHEMNGEYGKCVSHYPFSPSALDLYSQKKRTKFTSTNRKDFSNIKLQLKNCKLHNVNHLFPIRTRLSCFFPSPHTKTASPPTSSTAAAAACAQLSETHNNRIQNPLMKDDTFAEHPFLLPASEIIQKRHVFPEDSFQQPQQYGNSLRPIFHNQYKYSPVIAPRNSTTVNKSKFLFDPTTDLTASAAASAATPAATAAAAAAASATTNQEDSISNSTANSARHFSYSMFPDGVRPCLNLDLDKQPLDSQTHV